MICENNDQVEDNQKEMVKMIKKLESLHDYVKKNYEAGKYDASANEYKQWTEDYQAAATTSGHADDDSDYDMGYQQSMTDHDHGFSFRNYPEAAIDFGNLVSGNRMHEVADFIKGYNAAKKDIVEKTQ